MTLKDHFDSIEAFNVSKLFHGASYRIVLSGNYDIIQEGGKNIMILNANNDGRFNFSLKFQQPTFDNSGEVYAVLQFWNEDAQKWEFVKDEALPKEDRQITPDAWNSAGRKSELTKNIHSHCLEENAGKDIKIVLVPSIDDMPFKGKKDKTTQYESNETITIGIDRERRKIITRVRIPNLPPP